MDLTHCEPIRIVPRIMASMEISFALLARCCSAGDWDDCLGTDRHVLQVGETTPSSLGLTEAVQSPTETGADIQAFIL
jgi:hypothetical protein